MMTLNIIFTRSSFNCNRISIIVNMSVRLCASKCPNNNLTDHFKIKPGLNIQHTVAACHWNTHIFHLPAESFSLSSPQMSQLLSVSDGCLSCVVYSVVETLNALPSNWIPSSWVTACHCRISCFVQLWRKCCRPQQSMMGYYVSLLRGHTLFIVLFVQILDGSVRALWW